MEDYYKLLDTHYNATCEELNSAYKNKLIHYKSLPFMTDNDKQQLKELKKAITIFNNPEYKNTYDQYLQNKFKKEVQSFDDGYTRKRNMQNSSYISDRIFDMNIHNKTIMNIEHNELLRPKNVGLGSDNAPEFDKPLDFKESNDFMPYNFDL